MNKTKYLQADTKWGWLGYPKDPWYIRNCGCGEVAITNAIIEVRKYRNYTPATVQPYMKQFAESRGNGTYHYGIPTAMKHYGMTEVAEHATMAKLWKELAKGERIAVLLMGSRAAGSKGVHWTGSGHFIEVSDYKKKDGKHYVYVKDSASNSSLRNKWITYEGNIKGACLKCWSGKLSGTLADAATVAVPGMLVVDGIGGVLTVKASEKFFGLSETGTIEDQRKVQAVYYPALTAVEFSKDGSSALVKAIQTWIDCGLAIDGIIGKGTAAAWQHKLKELGYYTGIIDGYFGVMSMMAWQEFLNDFGTLDEYYKKHPQVSAPKPYSGKLPTADQIHKASNTGIRIRICKWAKKTAKSGKYKYKKFKANVKATWLCPICNPRLNYKPVGGNCAWWCNASWHHGGKCGNDCDCNSLGTDTGNKLLKQSKANALKTAQASMGIDKIEIIRNSDKSPLKASQLKKADICVHYDKSGCRHDTLYMGDGKLSDCTSGRNPNIKWNSSYASYNKKMPCRVAIRYTGYHDFLQEGDQGAAVKLVKKFLNWYGGYKLDATSTKFDKATTLAVKDFEKKTGLTVNGKWTQACQKKAKSVEK